MQRELGFGFNHKSDSAFCFLLCKYEIEKNDIWTQGILEIWKFVLEAVKRNKITIGAYHLKFSLVVKGRKFYNWFWIKTTFWLFKKEKSSDYSPGLLRKIFIFPKKRIHWSIKFRVFNLKNVALSIVALWKVRQSRVKINNWVWQKAFDFLFFVPVLHRITAQSIPSSKIYCNTFQNQMPGG